MTSSKNDPFNLFADFDMSKLMGNLQIPGLDVASLMNIQRKNIEALTEANKVAVAGMQAVAKRQVELLAQAMAQTTAIAKEFSGSSNPQEIRAKQTQLTQQAFEKALSEMRELAELIAKSNSESLQVLNKRFVESLEELKSISAK